MSKVWLPESGWKRKPSNVSRRIKIIKSKKVKVAKPTKRGWCLSLKFLRLDSCSPCRHLSYYA